MKIHFWSIGRYHEPFVEQGVLDFTKRLNNYFPVSWKIIPTVKNSSSLSMQDLRKKEGEAVLKLLGEGDFLVLLDERGKQLDSMQLAHMLQTRANESVRQLIFLIGGAFGVDEQVKKKAGITWSLSALTFPHQLVRLILAEQVYRACTILKNEKYHHH